MTDLPNTLTDLTAESLSGYFSNQGHDVEVSSLVARPMNGFVGAMGEVGFLDVTYADESHLPNTFVGKCPLDDDMARMYSAVMNTYKREHGFYRDLGGEVPMTVADVYVNEYNPETNGALLLLERVEGSDGDILEGCSVETMHRLLTDLAKMHGQYWMSPKIAELDWNMNWRTPTFEMGIPIIQGNCEPYHEAFPDYCPPDMHTLMMQTWVNDTIPWLERAVERPWTFCHLDYELDNIVFRPNGEPVILDWQTGLQCYPGCDVAWLINSAATPELIEAEKELLGDYLDTLAESGGPAWSMDQLKDDMCFSLMYHITGVTATLNQVHDQMPADVRPRSRFEKFLTGNVDAGIRWEFVERVSAMR
jgi:hypothetical protein